MSSSPDLVHDALKQKQSQVYYLHASSVSLFQSATRLAKG